MAFPYNDKGAFPWGMIVGLAGQTVSGFASAINNRKMQQAADAETARQVASNEAKAYKNLLSRSENQQAMAQYDRTSKQQLENALGVATVSGATPEYALGVQKGIADGRAELMSGITAGASAQNDKYLDKAEKAKEQKFAADQERRLARNTTYANLAANAASAAGSIIDSYVTKPTPQAPAAIETPAYTYNGVTVTNPPASLQQEINKKNTGLAAIKRRNGW